MVMMMMMIDGDGGDETGSTTFGILEIRISFCFLEKNMIFDPISRENRHIIQYCSKYQSRDKKIPFSNILARIVLT